MSEEIVVEPRLLSNEKLRVLCIGDMHFKENNLSLMSLLCDRLLNVVSIEIPDVIVLLGDTMDRFSKVHTSPWKDAIVFLEKLVSFRIPTYLIIGNHDYPNNSVYLSQTHPFYSLHRWPDIIVVDRVTSFIHKGYRMLLTPYVAKNLLTKACESFSVLWYHEHDIHFGHSEVQGCKMGGIESNSTDVWREEYCFSIQGHCHDYHELKPNIVYIGTPMQHSNSDNGKKTISLFTFEKLDHNINDKIRSYSYDICPLNKEYYHKNLKINEQRIDLKLPKHKTIYFDYHQFLQWYPNSPLNGYDLLRIVVRGIPYEISTLKSMRYMSMLKERGIKLVLKEKAGKDDVTVEDIEKYSHMQKPRFRDLLFNNVKDSPPMLEIYKKICIDPSLQYVQSSSSSIQSTSSSIQSTSSSIQSTSSSIQSSSSSRICILEN